MVARMRSWRKLAQIVQPADYTAMEHELSTERWKSLLKHSHGEIFMNSITASNGTVAALFASRQVAGRIPEIEGLYLTTNSLVLPDVADTRRVLLITAVYKRRALLCGWVLINQECVEIYRAIADAIKAEIVVGEAPKNIIANCDSQVLTGIMSKFPTTQMSIYDFILTLLNFASQQRGVDLNNEQHCQIVTKLVANYMGMESTVQPGFEWILASTIHHGLYPIFGPILEWYSTTFVDVERIAFFFKKEYLLLNGTVRGLQKIKGLLEENPAPQWDHYKAHLSVVDSSVKDLTTLIEGDKKAKKNISMSPRLKYCVSLPLIRRMWEMLEEKVIEVDRFIQVLSFQLKAPMKTLIYQGQYLNGSHEPIAPREDDGNDRAIRMAELAKKQTPHDPAGLFVELNLTRVRKLIKGKVAVPQEIVDALVEDEELRRDELEEAAVIDDHPDWHCAKCATRPIGTICKPCHCIVLCDRCPELIRREAAATRTGLACPNCNQTVTTFAKVFLQATTDPVKPIDWKCTMCQEATISQMGRSCRHVAFCQACAAAILNQEDSAGCPQCQDKEPIVPVKFRKIQEEN